MRKLTLLSCLAVLFALPAPAGASHGRYYHYTATSAGGNSADYTLSEGWRRSSLSCVDISSGTATFTGCSAPDGQPAVGDIVSSDNGSFDFGDSTSVDIYLLVTAISITDDSLTGVALDPASFPAQDSTIRHDFAQAGGFLGFAGTCCRISELENNADGSFRAEVMFQAGIGEATPVSSLPPVVRCPVGGTCAFVIPVNDPNGDSVRFRFATPDEAGDASFTQPNGASIDQTSGVYSFDTTVARGGNAGQVGDLYSTHVVLEDYGTNGQPRGNKVALDFIIQLVSNQGSSPTFAEPPSPCGDQVVAVPGQQVSFQVQASDPDASDSVELNAASLPAGASVSPTLPQTGSPGAPVSATFNWTPSASQTGSQVVTFTATDSGGRQTLCVAEVLVNPIQISASNSEVGEGGTAAFTIGIQAPSDQPVNVDWTTVPGTATSGQDFEALSGTVTIPPGSTQQVVPIPTYADSEAEADEGFTVELSGAQGAPLGNRVGAGTILDDDPATLVLEPSEISRETGQPVDFTATVTTISGRGLADRLVRHFVTGANPGGGDGLTGASGVRAFSLTGANAGDDTVTAYADTNGNGEPNAGEPRDFAVVHWTTTAVRRPSRSGFPSSIETADTLDELSDPTPFREMNIVPVGSGTVLVKLPGGAANASQSGRRSGFIRLQEAAQVPVGSVVNAAKGRTRIEAAADRRGTRQARSDFHSGTFRMTQRRESTPVSEMILAGGTFSRCGNGRTLGRAESSQRGRPRGGRTVRRLWGTGKGRFRTRGRFSSATVRGTTWVVEDRCDGTLTRARSGVVDVRDHVRDRTFVLRRGQSHFAPRALRAR